MQVVAIILFVVLAVFTTWFLIDTIREIVKKVRQRRAKKHEKKDVKENTVNDTKVE